MAMSSEVEAHVCRRFDLSEKIGNGAYGVVWKGFDKRSRKVVALKKCFDAFRNSTDAQRTFREVNYLQAMSGHENIIRLFSVVKSENDRDIYLTFELMETDLNAVIKSDLVLLDVHKKKIIYQALKALKFVHSAELLHRDIKPSNLLLNSDCHVKLCDFGLCRSIAGHDGPRKKLTDYVATRWYRSPEVLMGSTSYTKGVDMWSVGCILGEMLLDKRPLFPGNSTINQIEKILEIRGFPSPEDIESMQSPFSSKTLASIHLDEQSSLPKVCQNSSFEAIDFMDQCLQFSPAKRCSAEEALMHPYVAKFHNPQLEPHYPDGAVYIDISDDKKLDAGEYRERLYHETQLRRKEARKSESANKTPRKRRALSTHLVPTCDDNIT